jgi:hypothetical protein
VIAEPRLTCAWCKKKIAADAEIFTLSAEIRPEYIERAQEHEGQIVGLYVHALGRDVPVVIPAADSQAKRDGKEMFFPACSLSCGKALEATLHDEKGIAKTFLK